MYAMVAAQVSIERAELLAIGKEDGRFCWLLTEDASGKVFEFANESRQLREEWMAGEEG